MLRDLMLQLRDLSRVITAPAAGADPAPAVTAAAAARAPSAAYPARGGECFVGQDAILRPSRQLQAEEEEG